MKALPILVRFAVLPAVVLLAACGGETPDDPTAAATSASDTPSIVANAPEPAVRADAPRVTLMAGGLMVGEGAGQTLSFGMAQADAIAAMRQARGMPRMSRNAECGIGTMDMAKFGPITLNFTGGKFVGWHATEGANIVTIDGIQTGLTLDDIRQERSVETIDSTLDGEFTYSLPDDGIIGGFTGSDGRITSLYAGDNCFFR